MPTVKVLLQDSSASSSLSDMLRNSGLSGIANLAGLGSTTKRSSAELVKDLLQTTGLLDAVAADLNIVDHYGITTQPRTSSRKVISQHLDVNYKETSGILTIGYTDVDGEFAMKAVSRVVTELAKQYRRITMEQVSLKRDYLEQSVSSQSAGADQASRQLIAFQSLYGIMDVATQATEITRAVTSLQTQLTAKQLELKVQEQYLPEVDARIRKLKSEIASLQSAIESVRAGSSEYSSGGVPQKELPELQLRYATLKRDAELKQQILTALEQQLELVRLEALNTSSNFQIVEAAELPEKKAGPGRAKTAIIATFIGGVLSLLVAFVTDYVDAVRRDPANQQQMAALREALKPLRRRRTPQKPAS